MPTEKKMLAYLYCEVGFAHEHCQDLPRFLLSNQLASELACSESFPHFSSH